MGAPEARSRSLRAARSIAAAALAVVAGACSAGTSRDPQPLPPQTSTRQRPEPPAAEPTPSPPAPRPAPAPTTIVIENPEPPAAEEPSLAEAARKERERRASAAAPVVKLDNKNLGAFAADQKLTVASPGPEAAGEEEARLGTGEGPAPEPGSGEDESYWRDGVRKIRERWAAAVEDVGRLEAEAADLRRQFYSEDDPYVRDEQIKPEWDRALNELDRARRDAATAPRDLEEFLEEGRRAGALPGWLRDGIELEPEESAERTGPEMGAAEPREPVVVERDPGDPP